MDSVTQDFATNIYRMKELGFNAVRLPYRFSDLLATWQDIIEHECQVAPAVSPMRMTLSDYHPPPMCDKTHNGTMVAFATRLQDVHCNPFQSVIVQEKSARESSATDGTCACCAAECAVHISPNKLSQPAADRGALPK